MIYFSNQPYILQFQIQLGQQVLLASAHETPDGDNRRVHDTQLAVARQEGAAAQ